VAARVTTAARQLVRSVDLEEVLRVAASAIGEALAGEAVLRVTATPHDLHAGASGVVLPSALSPDVRAVLSAGAGSPVDPARSRPDETRGLLLESSGHHATCRVWVGLARPVAHLPVEQTLAELLLHLLALTVDRIVTADRFRESKANFERAVESHRLVGQAMGILIERHRIVSEEAFDVLRRASQDHNVKLREIARRVIDTGAEPDEVV
jgi:hypothetical protein